jgi:hypothetical protein
MGKVSRSQAAKSVSLILLVVAGAALLPLISPAAASADLKRCTKQWTQDYPPAAQAVSTYLGHNLTAKKSSRPLEIAVGRGRIGWSWRARGGKNWPTGHTSAAFRASILRGKTTISRGDIRKNQPLPKKPGRYVAEVRYPETGQVEDKTGPRPQPTEEERAHRDDWGNWPKGYRDRLDDWRWKTVECLRVVREPFKVIRGKLPRVQFREGSMSANAERASDPAV